MAISPLRNDSTEEPKKSPPAAMASDSRNPIVNMIDGMEDATVHRTGVDSLSQLAPYNSDDLYRKKGDYSIYEDMMKDDQVSVAMAVKKDLILGSGWHIACEEEGSSDIKLDLEVALAEDIEKPFEDCLMEMLTAYEIGFSVTEKQFKKRDDGTLTIKTLKTRNPVSWLFHQDDFGNVVKYEQQGASNKFTNIDPDALIHFINNPRYGNPYGTSDLRAAYAAYFIKTQIVRFYAIFLEKAASPTPVAKYDRSIGTTTEIQALHNTIKKLQTSSALTIPKDIDISFLEASGNGGQTYVDGINMFNMFIGRALFVPDLLGFQGGEISGGSYALGEHQMGVFFKHIMRRRRTIENLINEHLIKPMVIWNHGFVDNFPKFKLNPIEEKKAVENAKLWLEAVKGKALPAPTLEEINQFKRIVDFPETSEEEWEEMQEQDSIDAAARNAETGTEGAENDEGDDKDDGTDDEVPEDGDRTQGELAEEEEDDKGDKADKKEKFAKAFEFPKGDYHKKTDFKAIEKQLDSNLDLFVAKSAPIVKAAMTGFAERLSKWTTGKAKKLEQLDKLALPKPELRKLEKLLDSMFGETFRQSAELAQSEIFKNSFAIQTAPEFLKTLEEEDYNFIKDWEYQLTKRARTEIVAAVKDGKPISAVIDAVMADAASESATALERYARTKFTEVMNKGRLDYFKSTGVIGAYQYSAVLDDRTSDICAGLHGKIFKAGSEPCPPMHFNCRSVLVPITNFEEWEEDTRVGGKNIDDFIEENKGKGFARG